MTREFLYVSGCDDHTSIALDNLTAGERRLVIEICTGLSTAQAGLGCRPVATLLASDPDPDEREPDDMRAYGGDLEPPSRPLVVVTGGAS